MNKGEIEERMKKKARKKNPKKGEIKESKAFFFFLKIPATCHTHKTGEKLGEKR
jgi:hypothetical protein